MMYKEIITNKKSEVELYFGAEYNSDGALLGFAIIDLDNNRNFYAELIGKNNTSKNTIWNACRDNARYYSDKSSVGLYDLGMDYACGIYLTIKKRLEYFLSYYEDNSIVIYYIDLLDGDIIHRYLSSMENVSKQRICNKSYLSNFKSIKKIINGNAISNAEKVVMSMVS